MVKNSCSNKKPTISWSEVEASAMSVPSSYSQVVSAAASAAASKSLQSCPTLCDPTDGSPPGSTFPGILQARTREWVSISFSNAWKWKVKVKSLSRVRLFSTPWTAAYKAPPSMGFSREEYWSGVPLPSPQVISMGRKFLSLKQVTEKLKKKKTVKLQGWMPLYLKSPSEILKI